MLYFEVLYVGIPFSVLKRLGLQDSNCSTVDNVVPQALKLVYCMHVRMTGTVGTVGVPGMEAAGHKAWYRQQF